MLNKKYLTAPLALLCIAVLSGCGGNSYREAAGEAGGSNNGDWDSGWDDGSGGGSGDSGGGISEVPAFSKSFSITGSNSYKTTTINTDSLLKVTVRASYPSQVSGTGHTAAYSCLKLRVAVLKVTKSGSNTTETEIGSVGDIMVTNLGADQTSGYCNGAKTQQTIDFSSRLPQGHSGVKIKIKDAAYDSCRQYGIYGIYYYGCPISAVYTSHQVNGSVEIQTNGPY